MSVTANTLPSIQKLASVNVTKGQKISTKQVIGTAYTDEDNITEVHLEVWKGAAKLNPSELDLQARNRASTINDEQ